jgi:hypothetical protein
VRVFVLSAVAVDLVVVVAFVIGGQDAPAGYRFAGTAFHHFWRRLRLSNASLNRGAVLYRPATLKP